MASHEDKSLASSFWRVSYSELNSRQKESYNFHKLAACLAEFGFTCMKLADDWEGADFLAVHYLGDSVLKVQLKGRLTIAKKYLAKDLWIAFPHEGDWYLVEHDRLVDIVGQDTGFLETDSWASGAYSTGKPSKALLKSLRPFLVSPSSLAREESCGELDAIRARLHDLIRERAGHIEGFDSLDLPFLSSGSEQERWFPVPGWYGGFRLSLVGRAGDLELIVESWSRVVEGSGQRHRITSCSTELLEEGFV